MRPRDHVISHLKTVGEVRDPGGLASTALAKAVGYPGSSVAFAQLLSAMERSGLIEREIRGRRTYRISLAAAAPQFDPGPRPAAGFDYDELARWLLAEVTRRLTVTPPGRKPGFGHALTGDLVRTGDPAQAGTPAQAGDLARTVASLERKLASVESRQRRLRAENTRLRGLLMAVRQSLAEQQRMVASQESDAFPGKSAQAG